MAQNESTIEEKSKSNENNVHRPKLDKKRLSDVLYHLNITRKNFLIYPPDHVQTQQSIKKCHALLHNLLGLSPKITIGVAKDKLFVGNALIEDKGRIIRELALALKNYELAGITFYREISAEDLSCFFQSMAKDPEEIRKLGGYDKVLADQKIETIKLQFIDYSKFHHTEETAIHGSQNRDSQPQGSAIWTDFVSRLLSGSLTASGQGIPLKETRRIGPSQLALFLNENKIDSEFVLDTYRTTISQRLQKAGESTASLSTNVHDFYEMDLLLQELNPKLKKQFLLATHNQLHSAGENEAAKNLLSGFSERVVLEMLREANESGEQISPSLMNFVCKLTSAHDELNDPNDETIGEGSRDPSDPAPDTGLLRDIFAREKFEEYVTADYENTLNNLAGAIDDKVLKANTVLPIEDFHKELEPAHLDSRIVRIILAFMRHDIKPDEYENYAAKLVDIAYDLLRTGAFPTLLRIFKTLFGDYKNKRNPAIQSMAKNTLKKFHEPKFVSMAIVSFEKWAKPDDTAAYEFLKFFGSIIVSDLVGMYGRGEQPENQGLIFKLLVEFPKKTCIEAKRRFRDHRPSFVINMVTLVRRMGTEKDTPILKLLLKHHDADVRTAVLETLVELKDPDRPDVIRDFLRSIDPKEKFRAIQLIGAYKIAEMVPDLISNVSRWSLFKFQYEKNETIIKALGEIGNPGAVSFLEKLAKRRWAIRPKISSHMKLVLFQSLYGYELSHISSLLKIGQGSQDHRIREICQNIESRTLPVQ